MGMDLIGHGGAHFNWQSWYYCLAVASAFGWEPAGTVAGTVYPTAPGMPEDPNRKYDGYFGNDYDVVTDLDARALSLGLYRAIAALETGAVLTNEQAEALYGISGNERYQKITDLDGDALRLAFLRGLTLEPTGEIVFGEQVDDLSVSAELRRLADYCATGGFVIG